MLSAEMFILQDIPIHKLV